MFLASLYLLKSNPSRFVYEWLLWYSSLLMMPKFGLMIVPGPQYLFITDLVSVPFSSVFVFV